ncbi:MAG TPA: PEP-CTERM sorting domain-containing protein [Tepidisphaeraceae bacterium]|nr:PEP-CTERM sorting domain-containing protein [Tepidisphaeraceae bacterium]
MRTADRSSAIRLAVSAGLSLGLCGSALATTFTESHTGGGSWNTIYAQGFSPSVAPSPSPGSAAGDPVYLQQFEFYKSGQADAASNVRLVILNNYFANLQGLTTASPAVVGVSTNTVASTAGLATGAAILFDFDNLSLAYGSDYAAAVMSVGAGGELTPVKISALHANYTQVTPGDYRPATNYGTEAQYQYAVSNFINSDSFGQFFSVFSYGGDANFTATLNSAAPLRWNRGDSGSWTAPENWAGGVPNGADASAVFGGAATAPVTVTLDTSVVAGSVRFDNATHGYSIDGTGGLTLNATTSVAAIRAASGNHAINVPVTLADDTTVTVVAPGATVALSKLAPSAVALSKHGAGTLVVNNVRAGGLTVREGIVKVAANGTASGTSNVPALTVAAGATLDLTDNKLVTDAAVGTFAGSAYDGVTGLVQSGRNGGAWNGSGIITSLADAKSPTLRTSIGVATGAQAKGLAPGQTATWGGQAITATSTLLMYTYAGDANLDGKINGDDYFQIDSHVGAAGAGWFNGDFDYNGKVNGDDYFLIDSNVNGQTLGTFPAGAGVADGIADGVAAVPEPASAAAVALMAAVASLRRRRRQQTCC